jgi:hypothetical protein
MSPRLCRRSAFGVRRSAFGVRRSAFGVRRSAFGVRRSAFGVRRSIMERFKMSMKRCAQICLLRGQPDERPAPSAERQTRNAERFLYSGAPVPAVIGPRCL